MKRLIAAVLAVVMVLALLPLALVTAYSGNPAVDAALDLEPNGTGLWHGKPVSDYVGSLAFCPTSTGAYGWDQRYPAMLTDPVSMTTIARPIANLRMTVTTPSGEVQVYTTENETGVDPRTPPASGFPWQHTAGPGFSWAYVAVGSTVKIEDISTPSGFSGYWGVSENRHVMSVLSPFADFMALDSGSADTGVPGWFAPYEFEVTAEMVGVHYFRYNVCDWMNLNTSSGITIQPWYNSAGVPQPSYWATAGGGVYNPLYYSRSATVANLYIPGGIGGYANFGYGPNYNHMAEGGYIEGFPYGTWNYFVSLRLEIVEPEGFTITKQLVGLDPTEAATPFNFTVTFSHPTGASLDGITLESGAVSHWSGSGANWGGQLGQGLEWITFGNVPTGTTYQVTEAPSGIADMTVEYSPGASGDATGTVTVTNKKDTTPPASDIMIWRNQPLGFAEVKQGTFSDNRVTESWEVMGGVPTTETLYVNAGGTPVFIEIEARQVEFTPFTITVKGTDTVTCPGHSAPGPYGPVPIPCPGGGAGYDERTETYTHSGSYLEITRINFRTAETAVLENIEVFVGGVSIPRSGSINVTDTVGHYCVRDPGSNKDKGGNFYGHTNWGADLYQNDITGTCRPANANPPFNTAKGQADAHQAFAQSDEVTLLINGVTYIVMTHEIKQVPLASPGDLVIPTTNFKPTADSWDVTSHIRPIGYIGQPQAGAGRNWDPTGNRLRWVQANIQVPLHQVNGLYTFDALQDQNYMQYGSSQAIGRPENTNPMPDVSIGGGEPLRVQLQYTDYLMTGPGYPTHAAGDTNFKGPNPVVFHNPVSAQTLWVHDVPQNVLQDQRIVAGNTQIVPHPNVGNASAPTRGYISFDFQLTWHNYGSFGAAPDGSVSNTNFGATGSTGPPAQSGRALLNVNTTSPGTRHGTGNGANAAGVGNAGSWGFGGNFVAPPTSRSASYSPPVTSMDLSRWINAKYVRFSCDVRWLSGGNADGGFYPAGTWIQLYDNGYAISMSC